jgi:hypothetical protein
MLSSLTKRLGGLIIGESQPATTTSTAPSAVAAPSSSAPTATPVRPSAAAATTATSRTPAKQAQEVTSSNQPTHSHVSLLSCFPHVIDLCGE